MGQCQSIKASQAVVDVAKCSPSNASGNSVQATSRKTTKQSTGSADRSNRRGSSATFCEPSDSSFTSESGQSMESTALEHASEDPMVSTQMNKTHLHNICGASANDEVEERVAKKELSASVSHPLRGAVSNHSITSRPALRIPSYNKTTDRRALLRKEDSWATLSFSGNLSDKSLEIQLEPIYETSGGANEANMSSWSALDIGNDSTWRHSLLAA